MRPATSIPISLHLLGLFRQCTCRSCPPYPPPSLPCLLHRPRHMDNVQHQLERTTMALKRVRQDLRTATRKKREPLAPGAARPPKGWSFFLHSALAVWAVRNDLATALQFVLQKPGLDASDRRSLQDDVRAELQLMTEDKKRLLLHPTTKRGQQALEEARKFVAELDLHSWVRCQNTDKGVAPTNRALWRQCTATSHGQPPVGGMARWAPTASSRRGRRQWLRRWKRRWGVCNGRFKTGDKLPLEILRAKVAEK